MCRVLSSSKPCQVHSTEKEKKYFFSYLKFISENRENKHAEFTPLLNSPKLNPLFRIEKKNIHVTFNTPSSKITTLIGFRNSKIRKIHI